MAESLWTEIAATMHNPEDAEAVKATLSSNDDKNSEELITEDEDYKLPEGDSVSALVLSPLVVLTPVLCASLSPFPCSLPRSLSGCGSHGVLR